MRLRNLRSTNLNLLPILKELLRHRHVTHAARALNMSQSTVSEALGSLRHVFNDQLLVPSGSRMRLTAIARRLQPQLEAALDSVATFADSDWSSSGPRQAIDVAIDDYLIMVVGTELVGEVRRRQPDLALRFYEFDDRAPARLRSGDLDFIVAPELSIQSVEPQFERQLVFEDRLVCLVDEDSEIQHEVSEEQYKAASHVFFSPRMDQYGDIRTAIFQQLGEPRADSTLVQSHLLLPFFVERTEAIALAPYSLAQKLLPAARIRVVKAPFELTVRIVAMWDGSRAWDPVQRWFHDLATELGTHASLAVMNG